MDTLRSRLCSFCQERDGILPRAIARVTSARNRACAEWTLSLLDLQEHEHVLQVGDLAGASLEATRKTAARGRVVGVDPSKAASGAALHRNRDALRSGGLEVVRARGAQLPFCALAFDKAFSVGSIQQWQPRDAALREMRRVLRPGGTIAVSLQPRRARRDQEVRDVGQELKAQVSAAGFKKVRLVYRPMRPVAAICVLGVA